MKRILIIAIVAVCAISAHGQARSNGDLIRPIKVWKNGSSVDATSIDCSIVYDGLRDSTAKVFYSLKDSVGAELASGNLDISGADYRTFNAANNRINWTYNFTIRALRLQARLAQIP